MGIPLPTPKETNVQSSSKFNLQNLFYIACKGIETIGTTETLSSCQDSDASLNFSSPATLNFSTPTIEDRELEMLIIASIQTVKRRNKKFGKDEVFRLFRDFVDDVTKETFDKVLELLIQNKSVRLNIIENRECLSLPKEKK